MRVLLPQTSRHLRRRNALVKAAPCREGERPCASFGPSTGQGESTAFPTNPQFTAGTARSNTLNVWNLVTRSASLPQLYQEATCKMSVSRRRLRVTSFTCTGEVWPLKRLFSQHLLLHYGLVWWFFCMGFQPNRSTSMESKSRNVVTPLCKVRADLPHNSHLLHRMPPTSPIPEPKKPCLAHRRYLFSPQ